MRIQSDTKDALLFAIGLLGIIAQSVLAAFGIPPSYPLIGAYLTMCGVATISSILGGAESVSPPERDNGRPPAKAPRRKRKARTPAKEADDA